MDPGILVVRALDYAARLARHQFRRDGVTPQIYHPIGIASALSSVAGVTDVIVLAAAFLIDIGDDPDLSMDKIEKEFGSRIRKIVHEIVEDKNVWKDKTAAVKKPNVIYTYANMTHDARLIKLVDRWFCLNELQRSTPIGWDSVRVQAYHEWIKAQLDVGLRNVCPPIEKEIDALLAKRGLV